MAYLERHKRNDALMKQNDMLASQRTAMDRKPEEILFYEFEPAVVVDAVYDENHPILKEKKILKDKYPKNLDGSNPEADHTDYSWIGRIKFRLLITDRGVALDQLRWAVPLDITGVTELPLVNEVVAIVEYLGTFYYTRRINLNGFINAGANFTFEPYFGTTGKKLRSVADENGTPVLSDTTIDEAGSGTLGYDFKYNDRIRSLRRYEGDTIVESRFGSSIRFGGYGPVKDINQGNYGYADYKKGTGNPWVLIRNRQATADPSNKVTNHPKTYVTESVNNDGSSIHLTSGNTISDFKTTCKKVMLQLGVDEEQANFRPDGLTNFKFPTLNGDQIVINSDRLIMQARGKEFMQYAKGRFAMVTDDEFTLDAHKKVVMTTNGEFVINSPLIFLGEAYESGEPALLGRTTTDWLMTLCEWLANVCDWQVELCEEWLDKHQHHRNKPPNPNDAPKAQWVRKMEKHVKAMKTLKKQVLELQRLAPKNMSQRVYLVGGGAAPGQPGMDLK